MQRIAAMSEAARPTWEATRDPHLLQQFLKDHDCHGVDAVLATTKVMDCGLREAQAAFFTAPCRAAELELHNHFLDALESTADDVAVRD
ncbi:hypothetical protein [Kitasatospora sp. NPDC002040]|uniref:hypothetical protein n=1 Tax=Kitasatospora sp. NPDC002040 TaxID=3154661 RepID=UPI0033268DB0